MITRHKLHVDWIVCWLSTGDKTRYWNISVSFEYHVKNKLLLSRPMGSKQLRNCDALCPFTWKAPWFLVWHILESDWFHYQEILTETWLCVCECIKQVAFRISTIFRFDVLRQWFSNFLSHNSNVLLKLLKTPGKICAQYFYWHLFYLNRNF